MQITINTADILGNETTIRDEVIEQVSTALITSMRTQARDTLTAMLEKNLAEVVSQVVAETIAITIDTKFTDTDSYGRVGKEASIRERIADYVQAQCTFKSSQYNSEMNPFSQVVKETVESEVKKFKADFTSLVNKQLITECLNEATAKLRAACGIK